MKTRRGCPRHPKKAAFPGHMRWSLIWASSEAHLSLGSSRMDTSRQVVCQVTQFSRDICLCKPPFRWETRLPRAALIEIRPHQEYFVKGITRVIFRVYTRTREIFRRVAHTHTREWDVARYSQHRMTKGIREYYSYSQFCRSRYPWQRRAVRRRHHVSRLTNKYVTKSKIYIPKSTANCRICNLVPAKGIRIPARLSKLDTDIPSCRGYIPLIPALSGFGDTHTRTAESPSHCQQILSGWIRAEYRTRGQIWYPWWGLIEIRNKTVSRTPFDGVAPSKPGLDGAFLSSRR